MTDTLKIALAQVDLLVGDVEGNAERIRDWVFKARDELGADLVLFPELAITGYPPEDLLLRASLHARVERALHRLAHEVRGIDVVLGAPMQDERGLHNSALLLRDGAIAARYDKQILPNYSVFDEKRYFVPGHGACVIQVRGVPLGLTVCEDIWQPEPAARAREAGARLILNINASPYHRGKREERLQTLRARVRETGLSVLYLNLVGGQDELVFDGQSLVMGGDGEVRQSLPAWHEALSLVSVDCPAGDAPLQPRAGEQAPLADEAAELYQALVTGVRDYVSKNGFRGAVLGLSGGIDSALTLCIAVDALGADAVEAVMMPYRYTASMSVEDARSQAQSLGVRYREIPIEPMVEAFMTGLAPEFEGLPRDTTEENIQARCRGVILMAISNKTGRMLLTTGNKSEMAVGYATLYGDMAGGFAPLKDVSKLWVFRLAEYRNTLGAAIPRRVIERPPSAELAPGQQDSDSLPPYEVLDPILERFVEQDQSVEQIVRAGFDEATVQRVATLVLRNEYKRRQAPPGVRVTRRGFGKDRRYPITSGYGRLLS
ncbi:NAD+ synthase [Thioalkalivibrio sulfidiphilus]|uniref:Glutamine-dependent NAD(+) synthetase n=1 Tax=Thioalkalivibrio sulfidiphilus (strain HL-EbGR7) TaxID=396588 RepID=B8GN41_THISH|nr:NAD+ synthase [Thioalkalivibrio sulfidiphilus]ACL71902.1 NAD+ synthetase [Thioalkalivibrio sulfidiphilus HL-EbGr7]